MKFTKQYLYLFVVAGFLNLTSCSSDDDVIPDDGGDNTGEDPEDPEDTEDPEDVASYVIAADDSENSYLITGDDVSSGSVTAQGGSGEQVVGTPSWFFYKDVAVYSFVYRQGDPGTTQSYALDENGELVARNEIDLQVSVQSRGIVGDELYVQYSSRNYEEPVSTFYRINGETQAVDGPYTIDTEALAGNGEIAYVTDVAEYNDQVLLGYRTITGGRGETGAFDSEFTDHTYVGVFSKDLELQYVIEDEGRTGNVAGQTRSQGRTGIEPVENGDIYVFSGAKGSEDQPSGVLKINNGEQEFDSEYFFNISEASGGHRLYRTYYVGEDTFVLQMYNDLNTTSGATTQFAVVNVVDQTFDWVTGVPDEIQSVGDPYIDEENNEVVFPVESNVYPTLYVVDAGNATMTEGLEVVAEGIGAVGKLTAQE